MDLSKQFDSEWIKANINVKQNDHLRFLDEGEIVPNKRNPGQEDVVFTVGIVRDGTVLAEKKFSLNRGNFKAVSKLYGVDSSKWIKKEMRVNIVKKQNPQSGELVDSIALSAPGVLGEVENIESW